MTEQINKALDAVATVIRYLDYNAGDCGSTIWRDKDGFGFDCDLGYLYEGLQAMKKYLLFRCALEINAEEKDG